MVPARQYVGSARPGHDHIVQFYVDDDELVGEVVHHLSTALDAGGTAIAIATAEHLAAFDAGLNGLGREARSRTTFLDAHATLQRLLNDGKLDGDRFETVIGGLFAIATGPVHIYGEMVAVLWDAGQVPAAIELEASWNDLALQHTFALLCGYASESCRWDEQPDDLARVCDLHGAVIGRAAPTTRPDVADAAAADDERVLHLAPERSAVRAARAFVRGACASASTTAREAAELIVSELVGNAFEHGRGEIVVRVLVRNRRVRISVSDDDPGTPTPRDVDPYSVRGRGLVIVDRFSSRWGVDRAVGGGKLVWVEIELEPTKDRGRS
jgi:signal transduction histidine kinase